MTIAKAVIVVALLGMAGCARNDQLACGPALPPIATAAPVAAPPPGFTAPAPVAAAPAATVATPVAATALTPAQLRALNPMENRAAVAGR
jgi:hypothetical protein